VADLLNAFESAMENINKTAGKVYNIGGTRKNSISVLELIELLKKELNISPSKVNYSEWRLADQKVYISNTNKAKSDFNWEPKIDKEVGVKKLHDWIKNKL
jgi:CDP-paratose 2-epimerase